jgi:hypothetical protein
MVLAGPGPYFTYQNVADLRTPDIYPHVRSALVVTAVAPLVIAGAPASEMTGNDLYRYCFEQCME